MKVTITQDALREDHKLPLLPMVLYEHIDKQFNIDYLLSLSTPKNNDEKLGYIRGVRDVLSKLKMLTKYDNEE